LSYHDANVRHYAADCRQAQVVRERVTFKSNSTSTRNLHIGVYTQIAVHAESHGNADGDVRGFRSHLTPDRY